jgi:hypothetical protein
MRRTVSRMAGGAMCSHGSPHAILRRISVAETFSNTGANSKRRTLFPSCGAGQ